MKRITIIGIILCSQLCGMQRVRQYSTAATSPATREAARRLIEDYYYSLLTRPGLMPERGLGNRVVTDFAKSHIPDVPVFFKTAAGAAAASTALARDLQQPPTVTDIYS